jgi:hypothetical protein
VDTGSGWNTGAPDTGVAVAEFDKLSGPVKKFGVGEDSKCAAKAQQRGRQPDS